MNMYLADYVEIFPQCRLWLAYFDGNADESIATTTRDKAEAKLSTQDLHRWQQFRPALKKRQFVKSRLAIRAVLEREFGDQAAEIQFDTDLEGGPVLLPQDQDYSRQISLTHSGSVVGIVISKREASIGVDLETSRLCHAEALRIIVAHAPEWDWCNEHAGLELDALLTLWTIKEAVWKSLRCGQKISVADIIVDFASGHPNAQVLHPQYENARFEIRLFASQCSEVIPATIWISPSGWPLELQGKVTFHGCVAQLIQ